MVIGSESEVALLVEELRSRAGAFVNSHVGLWVTVEEDGALVLGGQDPAELFQAAADWLGEGADLSVDGLTWSRRASEPAYVLRLALGRPGARVPVVPAQSGS